MLFASVKEEAAAGASDQTFDHAGKKIMIKSRASGEPLGAPSVQRTHRWLAIVCLPDIIQNHILDENRHSFQYERQKQMHVDVVSRAVQLPVTADK